MKNSFVELHLMGSNNQPIILNTYWIEYIKPLEKGSTIYLATVDVSSQQANISSRSFMLHVLEDYITIKEMLRCK